MRSFHLFSIAKLTETVAMDCSNRCCADIDRPHIFETDMRQLSTGTLPL